MSDLVTNVGSGWQRLLDRVAPRRVPITLLGLALAVLGTLSPWATFPGFPGKMTLQWHPGGARAYVLVLVLSALLVLVDVPGRGGAGWMAGLGALVTTGFTILAILDRNSSGVAWGALLTLAGTALVTVGLASLPADRSPDIRKRLPAPVEILVIAGALGLVLYVVDAGLEVEASSQFIGFLMLIGFGSAALARLGVFTWLGVLFNRYRMIALAATALTATAFPFTQNGKEQWLQVAARVGVFAVAAIGLNVVVGLAGLLDLGYVAFFGVGAYVGGLFANASLTTIHVHLPFPLVVLMGACIAAIFGVIIGAPTLRLRGDYLAIVTLAFGEIFRIAANNLDGTAGPNITRGPNAIAGVPNLAIGDYDFGDTHRVLGVDLPGFANYYFLELVLLAIVILVFSRLNASRIGRAWVAIREDETAAAAMGVNTIRLKLLAFAIGAFLAGAAGTAQAHVLTSVAPDSYTFLESIILLAAVVLGGMGTIAGAIIGTSVLLVLPEKLRSFSDYRLLLYGLALVVMMRFRPEGIIANKRRAREFHESDHEGDALSGPPGGPVSPVEA